MANPLRTRSFLLSYSSHQSGWLRRIRENLRLALAGSRGFPSSANGAPVHFLEVRARRSARDGVTQVGSALLHGLLSLLFLFVATHVTKNGGSPAPTGAQALNALTFEAPSWMKPAARPSSGSRGGGGDENPLPATAGALAPPSRFEFAPPRLPDGQAHPLNVPVTVYNPQAPEFPQPVKELGLPWLQQITGSAGPGRDGVGKKNRGGMGDAGENGAGRRNSAWPYAEGVSPVVCKYCPDPTYTDEARKAKMQGVVTLHVLVGSDGRAHEIQVMKGLGLGLDDRAIDTVRSWRFLPAMDAARQPVPTWVLVEVAYRLF